MFRVPKDGIHTAETAFAFGEEIDLRETVVRLVPDTRDFPKG